MSLELRREKRRQPRNYKAQSISAILRSFQEAVANNPAPVVNVAPPSVEVKPENHFSAAVNVDTESVVKHLKELGIELKAELSKPRKVVCDANGEPIGTVSVESL